MLNPQQIKNILKENNIAVLKKFGQNFLISESVLNKIIETANIKATDTILEIGPGLGVLTFELAKKAKQVIAVEKDRKMAEILQKNLAEKNISNVEIINADALALGSCWYPILGSPKNRIPTTSQNRISATYKLVSNLPYNIATAVIMKFLEAKNPPELIVVMIQKEVAQRIVAVPPHMNKLAIFCQLYATSKIIEIVPPSAFYPKPKVDSAILAVDTRFLGLQKPSVNSRVLADLINFGFSHPRKTLLNNLYEGRPNTAFNLEIVLWLQENNIQPSHRPVNLTFHIWLALA